MKEFLRDHDIEFDEDAPETHLLNLAHRRQRRLERAAAGAEARRALIFAKRSVPLLDVRRQIEEMRVEGVPCEKWIQAVAIIEDIADEDLVIEKHEVGQTATCRGKIVNGQCTKCEQFTTGFLAYSFLLELKDAEKPDARLLVRCTDNAGMCLFNRSAAEFNAASADVKEEKIESVMLMKYTMKLHIEYKGDHDIFVLACNFKQLPIA